MPDTRGAVLKVDDGQLLSLDVLTQHMDESIALQPAVA
jgi:hypothetical protein